MTGQCGQTTKPRLPAFVMRVQIAYLRLMRRFYESRHPLANSFGVAAIAVAAVVVATIAVAAMS